MLRKIANALGVTTDDLIERNPDADAQIIELNTPKTMEAQILAKGVDKLPKAQREQALNVVKAMFIQYADYFEKGNDDDDSGL